MTDKNLYTNRLIKQKSPYLLQHAHNPVDWYPWGKEAFNDAIENDKPIFLSIGYATCHWCHVMENECFENLQVAQLMNETFVNIKVDREELPEVDGLYMEFAQSMMAGSAGWPLNLILTPELKPFFAATYLPPVTSHGLMGLTELIMRIKEVWYSEERESIMEQSSRIVEVFNETIHYKGDQLPEKEIIEDTSDVLFKMADPVYGGMKGTPKFPIGYQANLMLRYSSIKKDSRAVFLVERTLDMMHRGGIYDHLGGGFSRYSVDEKWLIPHFEKMLYDNALLIESYLETWQMTKRPLYREICREVIEYVLRDMTHPEGGFYSAEDADSEGIEGFFYTWPFEEIQKILGEESALFCEYYQITPEGNFEGRNILNTPLNLEEFAHKHKKNVEELKSLFATQKQRLWETREKRIHPFKDDKILSSWNGLMIHSLVQAGAAFSEPRYFELALKAAQFIQKNMWDGQRLLRRWRENEALYNAGLDEYAFLIRALISLFEADLGSEWLIWAKKLTDIVLNQFKAPDQGAFFQTDGSDPSIILRKCQFSDGAEPSGNAIHCENLLRLYQITADPDYLDQAEDVLRAVKKYLDNYAPGYCYHLMNLNRFYDRHAPTIVVALNEKGHLRDEVRAALYTHHIPHKDIIWLRKNDERLLDFIPFLKHQRAIDDKTTLYICHEGVCQKPLSEEKEIFEAIHKL